MTLWALRDDSDENKGIPTSGKEAIRRRDEAGEKHTYYSLIFPGVEITPRKGTAGSLVAHDTSDHFMHPEGFCPGERRGFAAVARMGIESVLRDAGDLYEVGRGRLFTTWDTSRVESHHVRDPTRDTGLDVVYAMQNGGIDYVIFVFDRVPDSVEHWQNVASCAKSGPANGIEKYVVRADGSRTRALGEGRTKNHDNGKVYVATVLAQTPENWPTGEKSFIRDVLAKMGPVNYYDLGADDLKGGELIAINDVEQRHTSFTLSPVKYKAGQLTVGSAHPRTNRVVVGVGNFTEQGQRSLFADNAGGQGSLL